jgi:LysM repeat protein
MRLNYGAFWRALALVAAVAVAACETREGPEVRYVPPEPPARGPNAPFPVPVPVDKPEPAYPIAAAPLGKAAIEASTLDDVPGGGTPAPPRAAPGPRAPSGPAAAAGETLVTVQPGDTVYALARRHGVRPQAIIDLNGLQPPYALGVGQRLRIPGAGRSDAPVPDAPAPDPAAREAAAAPNLIWPARGDVVVRFGEPLGGKPSDGLKIRLPRGAEVRAVAAGTVVYTGDGAAGFGNLILLRHARGWISAYGHNDDILVSRGQAVAQGAVIARAGTSGGIAEPQLHFELRQGNRPVDPVPYLPPADG